MRVAALDLGSNTSLLLIADVSDSGAPKIERVVFDDCVITKLGQGVHANRRFHPDALERMRRCLDGYQKEIQKAGCQKVIAVATSAARDVANGDELIRIGQERGIPIHIISGDREAQLTFRGALFDEPDTSGMAVIDVGGGSTEIILHESSGIHGRSVDVGSVRLTELLVKSDPITKADLQRVRDYVSEEFTKAFVNAPIARGQVRGVAAVAGTPTTLVTLSQGCEYSEARVQGFRLSASDIEGWVERMSHLTVNERRNLPGMDLGREDVIVTGAMILLTALRHLGMDELKVSTRGVRYGVALAWREF
jgi:exopolyphosphatase/guanosine-5'-triphosphate,3'-diphosphate pyrophosphatase